MKTPKEYRNMEFLPLLKELSRLFKPKRYAEVGVKDGYTFNCMANDAWIKEAVAVDVDPKYLQACLPVSTSPIVKGSVVASGGVTKYCMTSFQFAQEWAKRDKTDLIDFLFIDGDHSSAAVLGDVLRLARFVRPFTGLIFLHDTYPVHGELAVDGYCSDAWKAAAHIREKYKDFEIATLPGPWAGLSILRIAPDNIHLDWMVEISSDLFKRMYQGEWK